MNESVFKDFDPTPSQVPLSSPAEESSCDSFARDVEIIDPEAARRLRGHERTVQSLCSLATEEARARGLSILRIDVRPAWSHEYDERTGIVIDVEIRASSDQRFSYWDAVCERLSQLEDTLSPGDRTFLTDEISFIVSRS